MPDTDRRQQALHLIALRDVDSQRAEAQKLVDAVPRILAARFRDSDQARAGVEISKQRLVAFKTHLKGLELELASREEALQKANGNLLTAKTNQEYTALMSEIGRKRDEKGEGEEAVLEQYDVIKQGEQLVVEAGERLKEAESEYEAFEVRAP